MKLQFYALKDKLDQFKQPFVDINNNVCIRHLKNTLADKNEFSLNPSDFVLFKVGSFDTETGVFTNEFEHVVDVQDLVNNDPQ